MIVFDENIKQQVLHDTSAWYKAKSARMSKVIRIKHQHLDYYQTNANTVHTMLLPFA